MGPARPSQARLFRFLRNLLQGGRRWQRRGRQRGRRRHRGGARGVQGLLAEAVHNGKMEVCPQLKWVIHGDMEIGDLYVNPWKWIISMEIGDLFC